MKWETSYPQILRKLEDIKPVSYARTRNFINGDVTRLSPYISRGVISTKQVFDFVIRKGFELNEIEKFVQELAWRDYWQQIWRAKKDEIFLDLKRSQPSGNLVGLSAAIENHQTGIDAIDGAVKELYETGYMHNHVRMYVAAMACNMAECRWEIPAKWMYYHLLDGDLASNHLSWQWVAGSNSNKCYVANQDNINKYCETDQKGTFLDVPYEAFSEWQVPEVLKDVYDPELNTDLPVSDQLEIDSSIPTLIYNEYNLDPKWHQDEEVNRILLFEPEIYQRFPVSDKRIEFTLALSGNIQNIQLYTGSFKELKDQLNDSRVIYKEHPLNKYEGLEEPREWLSPVEGFFPSFFAFWKKCKKHLKNEIIA